MRTRFGLAAQVTVRCIGKVADAFKIGDKDEARTFHRYAAQPYDERIFRFRLRTGCRLDLDARRLPTHPVRLRRPPT